MAHAGRVLNAELAARLHRIAPDLPLDRVGRVAEALEESRAVTRFVTQLAATFAGLALLLAMIGVYGLTAGDVVAWVPDERVLFAGDLLFVGGTPIMWAGPIGGWIAACDRMVALDVRHPR